MELDIRDVGMCVATLLPDPMVCDRESFRAIARATADAGFREISFWPLHLESIGADAALAALAETGLAVPVVEAALAWSAGTGPALESEIGGICAAAERFGARIVGACALEPVLAASERAVEGFARLCEGVARAGLRASLEFLPWSGVPDLASAWRIVRAAGQANGGLLLDSWHWQRQPGGPDAALLREIPGERVHYLQLCDSAPLPQPDLMAEAMSDRRLPGEGCVDFAELLDALGEIGAEPFVAAEVFNARLVARGAGPAARAIRRACGEVARG